jgi:hypothetical protein
MESFRLLVTILSWMDRGNSPIVTWHHIVDAKLLTNLLNAQMKNIGLLLFLGHVGEDSRRQSHETSSLVLIGRSPSVAPLANTLAIGVGFCYKLLVFATRMRDEC